MTTLSTARLILRPWRDEDRQPFAQLNADPRVMEFFPQPLDRAASDELAARIMNQFAERGFGLWAVRGNWRARPLIGFVGLSSPQYETHFTPCVEIGWRLAYEHWGHGYATEGASAPRSISASTRSGSAKSSRSRRSPTSARNAVMQRMRMTHNPADDFDHPKVAAGNPLERHVLYRMSRDQWQRGTATR